MDVTTELSDPYCRPPADSLLDNAPWRRLLVLGDSIAVHPGDPVDGYNHRTWAARLAAALRPAAYLNLGVAGARVAEIRAGQLDPALAFRPDLAVLVAGANDAVRRSFRPPAVEAELERIMEPLSRAGALLVTFGCFDLGRTAPVPVAERAGVSDRLRALGRLTAGLSRRYGGVHLDFADHPAQRRGVLGADRLHIDARGHAVVATEIISALAGRITA